MTAITILIRSLVMAVVLLTAGVGAAQETALPLAEITTALPADVQEAAYWQRLARDLSLLELGQPLTAQRLAAARRALALSGRFEEIDLEVREDPDRGVSRLQIRATPYRRIRRIRIRGHYPLFESEVRQALPVYAGDRYDPAQLPAIRVDVQNVYRKLGYIDPQVALQVDGDGRGNRELTIAIAKGRPRRLTALNLTGNTRFGALRLKGKLGVWRDMLKPWALPFSETRLKKDIEGLLAFYRRKDFAEAQIDYTLAYSQDGEAVTVTVRIQEGPRYAVSFEGNDHFWTLTLKKDLVLRQLGNIGGRGLRRSIKQMVDRYRQAGFEDVRIRPRKAAPEADVAGADDEGRTRILRLLVEEGPRTLVGTIRFSGNRALTDEQLGGQLLTRPPATFHRGAFDPEVFEEDLFSLSALYLQQGYLEAQIEPVLDYSTDRSRVDIDLQIDEGPRTRVSRVAVSGSQVLAEADAEALLGLTPGRPFRRYMLQSDENRLAEKISEQGYPHVRVNSRLAFNTDSTRVAVTYEIEDGPYVQLGEVYTGGYFKTKPKVLRKTLKTKSGAPFSLTEMVRAQRDLRDMDIFRQVQLKSIGLEEQAETVHVVIDAEEKPPYYFQAGAGYETDTGFFGRGRVGDHNLFGLNKSGWLSGEISEIGYHGELGLTEPRLFGSRVNAAAGAFVDRQQAFNQDFGVHSYGATLNFLYPWNRRWSTELGMRYEFRDQFSRGADIAEDEADEYDPRIILVTSPGIRYDSRDDFIRPRSGILGRFSLDLSKGFTNRLDDFLKYELDLRFYLTPLERLTFAWRGYAGHLDPYGANRAVPDDQLFFLGGTNDVRGFEENLLRRDAGGDAVGGRNAMLATVEARIDLGGNFELTSFYDLGSLQDEDRRGGDPVRSAVGLGLRYHTPIGPLGLLYGHKLSREAGEASGRLHFSIGYTF